MESVRVHVWNWLRVDVKGFDFSIHQWFLCLLVFLEGSRFAQGLRRNLQFYSEVSDSLFNLKLHGIIKILPHLC